MIAKCCVVTFKEFGSNTDTVWAGKTGSPVGRKLKFEYALLQPTFLSVCYIVSLADADFYCGPCDHDLDPSWICLHVL